MRAPDFWQQNGLAARLLAPLGALYGLLGSLRRRLGLGLNRHWRGVGLKYGKHHSSKEAHRQSQ